ncbi:MULTISPECIES: GNAT family N-acetyltransferase [unclassified Pseudovibrio]|uniref:GNAT family N-acetyltransferase n=1 Tax=unclassified Pseudovibrio TaxID=2627060 RepID=UPI0007AED4F1|nr:MULTISPECIES: GNAT family N-acetyltransferase [unclassified Pseudovibrio]KZK98240.1 aminoalkylphosphonic acid N-acetyltransferase [Pseudovibrio sp. Ad5]KZL00573.1 aminoalkylphosphonic acid N-acetyltransferase [Pseudovibrio sp. W74]KZL06763.1 aminoalkylphosphonic acid N-acetyltransferase [Pseudovibrio sp. Ad14]
MLKIRVAKDEDIEAVVQMMNGGASSQRVHLENGETDTYKPAFHAIQQCPNTDIYVGETDTGEAVATFQLTYVKGLAFNGKPRGQIESMHTRADMRGQGIGQEMLAHAVKLARDKGCCMVQLTSNKERSGAHRFYTSNGFVPTHEGFKLIF